jgi:hypothetical protein
MGVAMRQYMIEFLLGDVARGLVLLFGIGAKALPL